MKHYLPLFLLAIALIGCENNKEAENTSKYKDFSVATYMYYYDDWDGITTTSIYTEEIVIFVDDYRCRTTMYKGIAQHSYFVDTCYYYYELDYPYITLYNVAGFFGLDFTIEEPYIRTLTKEELQKQIIGKAGVLKFSTDTTSLYIDEAFATIPFFSITGDFILEQAWRVDNPERYFPIPNP